MDYTENTFEPESRFLDDEEKKEFMNALENRLKANLRDSNQTRQPVVMYICMRNEDGSYATEPCMLGGKTYYPDEKGIVKIEEEPENP
jgi:hypothetical protein